MRMMDMRDMRMGVNGNGIDMISQGEGGYDLII